MIGKMGNSVLVVATFKGKEVRYAGNKKILNVYGRF